MMKSLRGMPMACTIVAALVACSAGGHAQTQAQIQAQAQAQPQETYPSQPIRMIVPTSPGGNVDTTGRVIATAMARILKTSIVVQNIPGAANAIGEAYVARAKPDGYTILCGNDFSVVTTSDLVLGSNVKQDDFAPIGMITSVPAVLEVKAGNRKGIRNFADFLAYAKAHPGDLSMGNAGLGSINHVAELMIERTFGIKLNIIPFKGAAPGVPAVIGGQVDGLVDQVSSSAPFIKAGQLLPLATTAPRRTPDMPEVPTLAELSNSDFSLEVATILVAPRDTPGPILRKLNEALAQALADPDVLRSFKSVGATPYPTSLDDTAKALTALKAKMQPLIDAGALSPQKVD
jgi:tripartite-type tricarboxylate transporter receptor subunit TctC